MKKELALKNIRRPLFINIFASLALIIIFIISSSVLYRRTTNILTDNLRERLLTISITAAANIDAKDLDGLRIEQDWQKTEWARVVNHLNKAKYSNKDIVFMYIFRKKIDDHAQMEFVADADSINPYANSGEDRSHYIDVNRDGKIEPDGPDKLQWPGQDYPEAVDISETFQAYNGPLTSRDFYTDDYGTVLTGYAPIRDESGDTVAVLATDIKANDFLSITRQTLYPFLVFILLLVSIIILLSTLLTKSIQKLIKAREEVGQLADHLKSINIKLDEANTDLEQKNGDLAIAKVELEINNRKLDTANVQLTELDKQKTEFLDIASHQLRTPLSAMIGLLSMQADGDFDSMTEKEKKEQQNNMLISADRLKNIVADLMDAMEAEMGLSLKMVPVNVEKLATEAINTLKPNYDKKGLSLKYVAPEKPTPYFLADPNLLLQVFMNLIDDACQYTEKGGAEVRVYSKNDKVIFQIQDTGIGVSGEEQRNLFKKFQRAKRAMLVHPDGSGLGLFIAQKIAKAHNGSIGLESAGVNMGTTFIVALPASPAISEKKALEFLAKKDKNV